MGKIVNAILLIVFYFIEALLINLCMFILIGIIQIKEVYKKWQELLK